MLLCVHRGLPSSSQPAVVGNLLWLGKHPWWVHRLAATWHLRLGDSRKPPGGERVDWTCESNPSQLDSHWLQTSKSSVFLLQLWICDMLHLGLFWLRTGRQGKSSKARGWKGATRAEKTTMLVDQHGFVSGGCWCCYFERKEAESEWTFKKENSKIWRKIWLI